MKMKMSDSLEKIQAYRKSKQLRRLPIEIEVNTVSGSNSPENDEIDQAINHFLGQIRQVLVKNRIAHPNTREPTRYS